MTIHRLSGLAVGIALAFGLSACPDSSGEVPDVSVGVDVVDVSVDVAAETTAETVDDTGAETVEDATPETGAETVEDATPETGAETVEDVTPDADPETVEDATPETGAETVDDVTPDTDPDSVPDAVEDTQPETADDTVDDTQPETTDDTVEDTQPDGLDDTLEDTLPDSTFETMDDTQPDSTFETMDDAQPDTTPDTTEDAETDTSGPDTAAQIAAARTAAEAGETTGSWMIEGAGVTYTKAELGSDAAGFFVQAGPTGPAMFVQLVEGSQPTVGDDVSFEITELEMNQGRPEAVAILDLTINSSANDYSGWAQDVTDVDLSAELGDYAAEVVTLTGVFVDEFGFAGTSFDGADMVTTGDASGDIVLRMPTTEADALALLAGGSITGCTATVTGPLWQFNTSPQPSVWSASDVTLACPAIAVDAATSVGPTTVAVTFTQEVDPASVLGDGSQFTFDGGLIATAATVDGATVTVELSSAVAGGTEYTVTVADTVLSAFDGQAVDPAANTAVFLGLTIAANLVISEVDYDQSGTDTAEFVEIYNPTADAVVIDGYEVLIINGSGPAVLQTITLAGTLEPGAFAVIGNPAFSGPAPDGVLLFPFSGADNQMQNSTEGVQLTDGGGNILDSMSYEGDVPGSTEGSPAGTDSGADSLQRCPAGSDNDDNSIDFILAPPTPGADCP